MARRMDSFKQPAGFERDRIRALKNERIFSQKKTFTKWINSFLVKDGLKVNDLFEDICDGKVLVRLLENISGEKIGFDGRGNLRVHKIANVNKALEFLQRSVKLESIGAEDVVDGNDRLILGLIWMVILRFQINDVIDREKESGEKKSAKDALLLWCQRKTKGYPGVDVQNFTSSWKSGLAFNALIHKHRPDLIKYEALRPSNHEGNLQNAFDVAWDKLGIPKLLDPEDVDCARPDDKSIMTYVSTMYQCFAKMKSEETGGRRIAKIVGLLMEVDQMTEEYGRLVTNLLEWINKKVHELRQDFTKSLTAVQQEMSVFKHFRTVQKPPKYTERVNIEAHLFSIVTKIKANNQKPYAPPEGKTVADINKAWQVMEKAEHDRGKALREELIRQERLEKLAQGFERKAALRDSWLGDMIQVLGYEEEAQATTTIDAALQRHQAISTDVKAREDRFGVFLSLGQELINEEYHGAKAIKQRTDMILAKWKSLLARMESRRQTLQALEKLSGLFREMDSCHVEMQDIELCLRGEDYGKHLLDVENLLQKHSLLESQIASQGDRVKSITTDAQRFINKGHSETPLIQERQKLLEQAYKTLVLLGNERKERLEASLQLHLFFTDVEEEEFFIKEKEKLAASKDVGKDLISLTKLQQKQEAFEAELSARHNRCGVVCAKGQAMVDRGHYAAREIKTKIKQLQNNWINLFEQASFRKDRLKDAAQSLQYYSDANDAESWVKEKMYLVQSEDYGRDEQSAQSLLQRHINIEDEIKAFGSDIDRLQEQSKLMDISSRNAAEQIVNGTKSKNLVIPKDGDSPGSLEQEIEVDTEEEVEEIIEKEVIKDVVQEVKIPQVKALYPYKGQGLVMNKAEVFFLVAKSNKDWWSVRRLNTKENGYVPANYVKEIEPKVIKRVTKQKVKVPEKVMVKRKVKKKVKVKKKSLQKNPQDLHD